MGPPDASVSTGLAPIPAAQPPYLKQKRLHARKLHVHVIDDGIGQCGELVTVAVGGQFPEAEIILEIFAHIRDPDMVKPIVEDAAKLDGIIVHTLVESPVLEALFMLAAEYQVPVVDLTTDLMTSLELATRTPPGRVPGMYHQVQEKHFQFCDAMKFILNHDDGMSPEDWTNADVLLLGVSRVGKTPLSVFMGTLGYKVANCPMVPGQDLPEAFEKVDRRRVFGMTMEPDVLTAYRQCRQQATWHRPCGLDAYTSVKTVWEEVEDAERRFKHLKVSKVDVTNLSIQCTANKIVGLLKDRFDEDWSGLPGSSGPSTPSGASATWNFAPNPFEMFGQPTEKGANVFLVASGIGYSGERMVSAVCAQFKGAYIRIEVYSHVTLDKVEWVVSEVVRLGGILVHGIVVEETREKLVALASEHKVPCVDLFGPFLTILSEKLEMRPVQVPGMVRRSDEQYFQFCRAVEYAMEHDDGAHPDGWLHADAVLLGVSRVGKSPLSIFLGTLGFKVANYPICPGIDLPLQLDKVDRRRVFGLLVDPEVLAEHRDDRSGIAKYGMQDSYSNMKQVMEELETVEELFKKRRIYRINVTGMPMESVADRIIKVLGDRFGDMFDDYQGTKRYQPL
eukprot:GGOE01018996.1.p1 GENE.GGOE01018996.1~~GGOE01018996.1.p1  ORF type:complete len:620 (-),score=223.30 GGOE01018996.1:659-2518(-)